MALTDFSGPLVVNGQNETAGNYNPDLAPSPVWGGLAFYDWRYAYNQGTYANRACGFYMGGGIVALDQTPATTSNINIAGLQTFSSGASLSLANGFSGTGVTIVSSSAFSILQTGNTVAVGTLVIDKLPGTISYGQNGAIVLADPTLAIARAVAVTSVSGSTGGDFLVTGQDLYGYSQTEKIASPAGGFTTNGKKAFKFVSRVQAFFSDGANNYSVGVADVYGFPLRVNKFAYAGITWANQSVASGGGTTFVAAQTSANAISGDVRGTFSPATGASDGTKQLQVFIELAPSSITSISGIFGVTPA